MERDFLGLSNGRPVSRAKEEVGDVGFKDLGYSKNSAVEWNKVYGPPSFMPAGVSHLPEVQVFPAAYRTASVSAANVFLGNRFGGLPIPKPPLLGGIPITTSSSLPTFNSFAGFMDPRSKAASLGSPPQFTIFYAGTVNVFDGISPEKAQAILLWAGNSSNSALVTENRKGQGEEIISKPMGINIFPNGVGVSSPVSVSSSSGTPSERVSASADKSVPTKAMDVVGSFCANMIPSVPQARKASLARFLEKRKERLINAMPYRKNTKNLIEYSTEESCGMNYSAN